MDIFLGISQTLLLGLIIYYIFNRDKKEREQTFKQQTDLQQIYASVIETISIHSIKSQQTMERLSVNLIKLSDKPREVVKEIVREEPRKIDNFDLVTNLPYQQNPIEKEDTLEVDLADMPRIPMVNGVNLQFEDEPGDYPINISPVGSISPNPIFNPETNNIAHG